MNNQFQEIVHSISRIILGKQDQISLALVCLFAQGHLLIEDIPGIGKTSLAKALSQVLGLNFRRIQCTSDMLPGDILGFSIFDQQSGAFTFHPGPIFSQIILADEINRATPKTQSALLEAMEERQVTVEGATRPLEPPFFVIATLNPKEQFGTFPLPESQLDRFLMRISLGYPDREAENTILRNSKSAGNLSIVGAALNSESVMAVQKEVCDIHISDALLDYVQDILDFSRNSSHFFIGLSPRAGLNLVRGAQSWAYCQGRDFALPEDVQHVLLPVVGHRLIARDDRSELTPSRLESIFKEVPVP